MSNTKVAVTDDMPAAVSEVAGPQPERLVDMAARLAAHGNDPVSVKAAPDDSPDGQMFAGGGLLPGADATLTGSTFQTWLDADEREPQEEGSR